MSIAASKGCSRGGSGSRINAKNQQIKIPAVPRRDPDAGRHFPFFTGFWLRSGLNRFMSVSTEPVFRLNKKITESENNEEF
jgi:hypothetical protein